MYKEFRYSIKNEGSEDYIKFTIIAAFVYHKDIKRHINSVIVI